MQPLNLIKKRGCFLMVVSLVSLVLLVLRAQASGNTNALEFSDDGALTLNAEGVPLGALLGKIQEKTGVELRIHENLLRQPISVSFGSMPLDKAMRIILRGFSYACIFHSNGKAAKIIVLETGGEPEGSFFSGSTLDRVFSYKLGQETGVSLGVEELERAIGILPPPDLEELKRSMGILPLPERGNP